MSDVAVRKAVTAHFIAHWGVPSEIHVQGGSRLDLAVIEFAPSGRRTTYRFATNGMSSKVQSSADGRYRTELFAVASLAARWIVQLLATLSAYPIEEEVSLGEWHTVPLGGPIVQGKSRFTALLIAPPGPEDPETVGAILGVTPEPILVHQVVAITEHERSFAEEQGSELLWERLLGLGCPLLLDAPRSSVASDR